LKNTKYFSISKFVPAAPSFQAMKKGMVIFMVNYIVNRLKYSFIIVLIALFAFMPNSDVMASEIDKQDELPVISTFTASKSSVTLGETIMLEWNVSNAESIEIVGLLKGPDEKLPLSGRIEIWPFATTTYILYAKSAHGTVSQSITVKVDKAGEARIDYFKASAPEVVEGTVLYYPGKQQM
jgi:hypothetical protein